jgi:hypothetical protein
MIESFITYEKEAVTSFFCVAVQEDRAVALLLRRERYTHHHRGHTEAPGRKLAVYASHQYATNAKYVEVNSGKHP